MRAGTLALLISLIVGACAWHESFDESWGDRWLHSSEEKYEGKFDLKAPLDQFSEDKAIMVTQKARHYGLTAGLPTPVNPSTEPLVLQYDVKLADGLTCGGAYLKFVTADPAFDPAHLKEDTPYTVMFGPDKCGSTNKVHLIIRHKSPLTGKIEEKHLKTPPAIKDDDLTHVYTAILYPGNSSYAVLIDGVEKKSGSLFEDFEPPFNPPKEISDPDDSKPEDWVDEARIPDPTASKPDDWDEDAPMMMDDEDAEKPEGWLDDEADEIDDLEAAKPEDWDDEEDGDWEPPKISNPKCADAPGCGEWKRPQKPNPDYKGKWSAPMIDNPAYKGVWKPRDIPNPDYYEDSEPLSHIGSVGAVAVEIWTMDEGYFFDNVVVSNSVEEAAEIRSKTWGPKHEVEEAAAAEKKAKEEEEEKKRQTNEDKLEAFKTKAVVLVSSLFEKLPPQIAGPLKPVEEYLVGNPFIILALVAALAVLPPSLIMTRKILKSEKTKVEVGKAKKEDGPSPRTRSPSKRASSPTKKSNGASKTAEIVEEDEEEEEEEEEKTTVRRRARRAD